MSIKQKIKSGVAGIVPKAIRWEIEKSLKFLVNKNNVAAEHLNISFSQEGEDLILSRLFGYKTSGFYVDIGAHHPFRFSNTYKFYLSGWRGINIEPFPGSMKLFDQYRPNDINLETAILNDDSKELTYYIFDEQAHNTFDEQSANKTNATLAPIKKRLPIRPSRLSTILDKYLPAGQSLDFFTVDVEGMDLEVLRSNDWNKYRPTYVISESRTTSLKDDFDSELSRFLEEKNYELIARAVNSLVYRAV